MIDDIRKKIIEDDNCKLSIEELKEIYEMESNTQKCIEFVLYLYKNRNILKDLISLYGRNKIAINLDELNENTICYVGNLEYDEMLPTYNLKYIYGTLIYELDEVYNLENLEVVIGNAIFYKVNSSEGLESLRAVGRDLSLDYIYNSYGLENLKYIGNHAHFSRLRDASGLSSLEFIGFNAYLHNLKSSKGLEKLKYIGQNALFEQLQDASGLLSIKYMGSANFKSLEESNGLENLEVINDDAYFNSLKSAEHLNSLISIFGDANFPCLKNSFGLKDNLYVAGEQNFGGMSLSELKSNEKNKKYKISYFK